MNYPLLSIIPIALSAALHVRAEYRGPRWQVYLFKPLTTSLIILLALALPPSSPAPYKALIVLGLLFSLGGDVFLMLPQDRFVFGLLSFLVAHLFYIAAFTRGADFGFTWWALLLYLACGAAMLALLWPHLGAMRLPVLLYMAVILIMGWQALERWQTLGTPAALAAAAGAALFVISDSALALDRFRRPFPAARALVLTTYFAAQWLIAWSVGGGL
jgi:uncharacterized membrane protein YhhN